MGEGWFRTIRSIVRKGNIHAYKKYQKLIKELKYSYFFNILFINLSLTQINGIQYFIINLIS